MMGWFRKEPSILVRYLTDFIEHNSHRITRDHEQVVEGYFLGHWVKLFYRVLISVDILYLLDIEIDGKKAPLTVKERQKIKRIFRDWTNKRAKEYFRLKDLEEELQRYSIETDLIREGYS